MNIFLVVGSLFPFDRLVRVVDEWAASQDQIRVIGQIGDGDYEPKNMEAYRILEAEDFNKRFTESDLIITHAGMGIILKSLVVQKPIVVFPRKVSLKEVNTDHQIATAKALDKLNYVQVAWESEDLKTILRDPASIKSKVMIGEVASAELLGAIRQFINES